MIKFNDSSILSGCIKELLHSFNLPTVKIPQEGESILKDNFYLYEDYIKKATVTGTFDENNLTDVNKINFKFNKRINNFTKNLIVENYNYDSYTHEYLGEYLRFIRDYKNLNLMSMYNCFSNNLPKILNLKVDSIEFNSSDTNYKIYMVPVKFFKQYTIAIESDTPVELVCALYDKKLYPLGDINDDPTWYNNYKDLITLSYVKKATTTFNEPFLYDLTSTDLHHNYEGILGHEKDLKLFIKLPINNNSTITILEGKFVSNNNCVVVEHKKQFNKTIATYDYNGEEEPDYNKFNFLNKLQLLNMNTGESHPFADRLIEYLLDNSITNIENIPDNIARIQQKLLEKYKNSEVGGLESIYADGIWESKYRSNLYDIAKNEGLLDSEFDILGYVDKDVEKVLGRDIDLYNNSDTKKKYEANRR